MRDTQSRMAPSRRRFLAGAAAGVASCWLDGQGHAEPGAKLPNILYVFSDEHRYPSMSFSEMPELKTPTMARMAREGFSFRQCVSNYPVCSPYRAMLLSGRWPYQTGVIDNGIRLATDGPSAGSAFQRAGYDTGYIGKWHLGGTRAEPFGFDTSLIWKGAGAHWDEDGYYPKEGGFVQPKGYSATLMTDQALEFMGRSREKPFFIMLSLHPPHASFLDPPSAKKALYPEGSLKHRPNYRGKEEKTEEGAFKIGWPAYQGYHAHISAIDDELGRLIAGLERLGIEKNTILLYSSDHGSMQGSHGVGGKRQVYEESIRVPFLAYGPGQIQPGESDALISTIDIAPTLCGLAGIPVPAGFQGEDFSPALLGAGPAPEPQSQFLMHIQKTNASGGEKHPAPLFRGVRTKRFVYAVGPDNYHCFFDLEKDPYQMKNLADSPETVEEQGRLRAILAEWLKKADDPYVLGDAPAVS